MTVNMGPQHPATHGVLRLVVGLRGEEVVSCKPVVGYLHTGIEKTAEYRNWVQGVTLVTRMDYLAPLFHELGYSLAVEKLLGIEAPPRAQVIRVMMTELNRIASHLVWLASTALDLGALSMMLYGFREREAILAIFEAVTGLRMNHAYIRPGGVAGDVDDETLERVLDFVDLMPAKLAEYEDLLTTNPIWIERTRGVGVLPADQAIALGVTGPMLRAAGVAFDVRRTDPYCGIEGYEFDIPTFEGADVYDRYRVRVAEIRESLKIVDQTVDRLEDGPFMIEDPKLAWPTHLFVAPDGLGNSPQYVRHIMGESMEALIHHFKMVTEGFKVPAGEVYVPVESPRGELGYHVVSDGGARPYRVHSREPSFVNLQATETMAKGGLVADLVAAVASIDPIMGGVDR
jgi:NADH-quinone oxidoreductase subunit D